MAFHVRNALLSLLLLSLTWALLSPSCVAQQDDDTITVTDDDEVGADAAAAVGGGVDERENVNGIEMNPDINKGRVSTPSQYGMFGIDPYTVFLFEMIIAAIVVAYIFMFAIGTRMNLTLARRVCNLLAHSLQRQFVQFGTKPEAGKQLTRDGSFYFWYFATGRRHTPGLTVAIDLAKRMDLFMYTSAITSAPQKDRVIFYLPISDDVKMDSFTLFMLKRRHLQRLRAAAGGTSTTMDDQSSQVAQIDSMNADVVSLADTPVLSAVAADLIVMAEHPDIVMSMLPTDMRHLIVRCFPWLVSVHLSDQGCKWDVQSTVAQRIIRVEMILPADPAKHHPVLADIARLTLHLLDAAATTRLTPTARKRVADLRKRATAEREKREQKLRAEEAANRRLEKKKQEEEAVGKMSAEKQRKYEEKKRKKEISTRMRKAIKK